MPHDMPNTGSPPRCERCDIRLRNGWIIRNVTPSAYRWKPWPWGESGGDVVDWREAA